MPPPSLLRMASNLALHECQTSSFTCKWDYQLSHSITNFFCKSVCLAINIRQHINTIFFTSSHLKYHFIYQIFNNIFKITLQSTVVFKTISNFVLVSKTKFCIASLLMVKVIIVYFHLLAHSNKKYKIST